MYLRACMCRALCKWMTFWFGTHSVLTFFKTGVFEWDTPFSFGGPKPMQVSQQQQPVHCQQLPAA